MSCDTPPQPGWDYDAKALAESVFKHGRTKEASERSEGILNFDPGARGFSIQNALACGQAAALAYRDPVMIRVVVAGARFSRYQYLSSPFSATKGFWAANENYQVVAFKGTSPTSFADIKTDLDVAMEDGMHNGFRVAFGSIEDQTIKLIRDCGLPLFLGGHSLGGGLTKPCANRAIIEDIIHSIYTFGEPRSMDRELATKYDARLGNRTYRVRCRADIIPHVPHFGFNSWDLYHHVGQDCLITVAGRVAMNPGLQRRIMNDVLACAIEWQTARHLAPLEDHHMDKDYLPALRALRPGLLDLEWPSI